MKKIKLPKGEWLYDPNKPLGPEGGFGIVFEGQSPRGEALAVKRLKIEANETAHRELKIAQEFSRQDFKHIIPCFDAGQDAESDHYFVVMAKAERSLQDEINSGKKFNDEEAARILLQIVDGLLEIPEIVHRDLKPGNVLFHSGQWKMADFGIARFVEESTSLRTLKGCLSPPYAAPEQWRFETSSQATDAYALGCIGYCVLTGTPPFTGPQTEDYQRQHLSDDPPKLDDHAPFLRSLISMLLRKSPEARPPHKRIRKLLTEGLQAPKESRKEFEALATISAQLSEQQAREEAEREAVRLKQEKRDRLAQEAVQNLQSLYNRMLLRISQAAPSALQSGCRIILGKGTLDLAVARGSVRAGVFKRSGWDVVAEAQVFVRQSDNNHVISSSLFYAKPPGEGEYRWWEIGFNFSPFTDARYLYHVSLTSAEDADIALTKQTIGKFTIQYGPKPIDDEDFEAFSLKWAHILAKASSGQL